MATVSQSTDTQPPPHIEASTTAITQTTDAQTKPIGPLKPRKQRHRNRAAVAAGAKWEINRNGGESVHFSVVVTGFPDYTQPQDLLYVLRQFGSVKITSIKNGVAKVAFVTSVDAQKAVQESNKVAIYGEVLTIKPLTMKDLSKQLVTVKTEFVRSKQKTVIIEPSKINLTGDFHTQLDNILTAVRLNQDQVMALSQLYTHLQDTLQALWPGCKAIPFGSIPTGLGIKTSDADCFILVPQVFRQQQSAFVNKAKRLLQQHPNIFAEILAIPAANTPIVKFFHVPTETNCDVSFKTSLGAKNSELIAFLLHADRRLIPMSVLIKYWAKAHDLSGTGRLTNYALTMLIIFYLQQPPITILPSVQWLQRDRANDEIVDNWNTGFMKDHSKLPANTNTSSISELIGGFFQYYSTFNFNELMVSPYLGFPVKKSLFKNARQLPPDFDRYRDNVLNLNIHSLKCSTPMCVQDPFEQCHNVASQISSNLAEKIKAYFEFAANAYEVDKLNGCQNFLKKILLEKPKCQEKRHNLEYRAILFPNMLFPIINPDWKSVVREAVLTLFETILKAKVEKMESDDVNKVFYKALVTKPIWNRKGFARLYESVKLDFVQKQATITDEIIKSVKQSVHVDLQVCITMFKTRTVTVTIRLLDGEIDMYRNFGRFYSSVLQNWIREILKPHVRPSPNAETKQNPEPLQTQSNIQKEVNIEKKVNTKSNVNVQQNKASVKSEANVQSKLNVQSEENAQIKAIVQNEMSAQIKVDVQSEVNIQSKANIQSKGIVQSEDPVQSVESAQSKHDVQGEEPVQIVESPQSKEDVQSEEPVQSVDSAQSKESVQSKKMEQSIETVQNKENVQSKDTLQIRVNVPSKENVQCVDSYRSEVPVQSEVHVQSKDPVQSQENVEDEDGPNEFDDSQTQSDDYQSCDESKTFTSNDEESDTMNISSLEKLKIT